MTLPINLSSKKGISFATICGLSLIAISMAASNIGAISDTTNLIYIHKAEATPHSAYDVKFEAINEHIVEDDSRYKELKDTIQETRKDMRDHHDEEICLIQQVKDAVYNVPETKCS